MDLGLANKVAVVLAGSAGIGRGIATILAEEGCRLAICARDETRLAQTAEEIRAHTGVEVLALPADVRDAGSLNGFFDAVFEAYGRVDILINNTGGPPVGKCLALPDEDYEAAFQLVLMSKIRACRRVVPSMAEHGWGRIINVESTSVKSALENMVLSNAFRSAATAFAKTLSMEHAREGIRVHTLLSGPFMTNRVNELGEAAAQQRGISFDAWRAEAEAGTALGRFGDPLEYGALAAFLASDRSTYMNGTCIAIDGGALKTVT
ncbi:SDR family oxidoreductase [Denitromonas halophila]|uniref:SDR family oxidoreductase n=1 Tax=Denitromonas halophila TaxID=1629404 RepID=A0A557QN59_9RHOO|nr:SDR family oxidoreductase [Denitromonas halophila]TVO54354.1 SDR family oxidoreductase [Denitromonas halophila]